MKTNRRCRATAVAAGLVALAGACGRSAPSSSSSAHPGQVGTTYLVTVSRQVGGTVTSRDGQIDCGTTGTRCGPATYAWSEAAILTATPDAGRMFGTWAGDCTGRSLTGTEYLCVLDTTRYGADKFVAAVFGEPGRTQHANFIDPAIHGPAFMDSIARKPDTFECTYCHGASYAGLGIAPSCTACHERAGFPGWLATCNFCHPAPPPPPPAGMHPKASSDVTYCWGCHQGTVDSAGNIIPGGNHMNGNIDATGGHPDGYVDPAVHGRDFFEFVSGSTGAQPCASCHGAAYDVRIAQGKSCNTCHEGAGWTGWQTNCSFCHGVKDLADTQPGYDPALHPTWAAPPDAISQRLGGGPAADRTGAHAIHLTGSAFAGAVRCGACHEVPSTLTHVSGRDVRAKVVLMPPGATGPDPLGYDPATATCATKCHGSNPSPAWTLTGIACDGCHGVPPATDVHAGVSGADLVACAGCHPATITPAGTIDLAGGKHVNGAVDVIDGHAAGFADHAVHGPQYLDHLAGATGAADCGSCHGQSLGYCTSCHSQPVNGGWAAWQTNCTFCHGAKTPSFVPEADLPLAAPPDAVSQRLDGVEVPDRTGQHSVHVFNGGFVPARPWECSTCHPVPADANHVSVGRRATVTLSAADAFPALGAADLVNLPSPLGTYDFTAGTCTSYCHGATMVGGVNTLMRWTSDFDFATPIQDCTDCHGSPPPSGRTVVGHSYPTPPTNTRYCGTLGCSNHQYHRTALNNNGYASCGNCHYGSAQGLFYADLHVNGKRDVVFSPPGAPGYGTKSFTATWDPVSRSCTSTCHTNSGTSTIQPW